MSALATMSILPPSTVARLEPEDDCSDMSHVERSVHGSLRAQPARPVRHSGSAAHRTFAGLWHALGPDYPALRRRTARKCRSSSSISSGRVTVVGSHLKDCFALGCTITDSSPSNQRSTSTLNSSLTGTATFSPRIPFRGGGTSDRRVRGSAGQR
jgi:hypothetical protein